MTKHTKPMMLVVDNDREFRKTIEGILKNRYGDRFQVKTAATTKAARSTLEQCQERSTPLAMLIASCRLPEEPGDDLIHEVAEMYPHGKRVLVATYSDKEEVLRRLNELEMDHYVLKPVQNPEDDLYPMMDDLLNDWRMHTGAVTGSIRIVGYRWSQHAHRVRSFLARNLVPYRWIEIEESPEAEALMNTVDPANRSLPVVFFPDDTYIARPPLEDLAERVGLQQQAENRFYDLVVVGGGPAGLSAAVYGASEGLDTLLIEAEAPGGQAGQSSRIENYLGFPSGLSGAELTRRAVAQAARFGVEILNPQEATGVSLRGHYRLVHLADGSEVACHVLLIATGVAYRRLNVPGEENLTGAGVYYGAVVTEAITCQGKEVFILGGGNSAGQAAMYLTRFANRVTILTIEESLEKTMSQYLIEQIRSTDNIHVRTRATITAVQGDDHLETVTIRDEQTEQEEKVPAAALFIFIGALPRTEWLGDLLARDEQGYILTGSSVVQAGRDERYRESGRQPLILESSVPGIFAAGDTRYGSVKRIASGVGEGAMAVALIHQYLATL